jgi:uncharacterized protein (DUF1330 family)
MPAYVIVDIEIHDAERYAEYRALTPATIEAYGGRFVVRGGAVEVLEGDWRPQRLVVLEFPTLEQAQRWYDSDEYREPKAMRIASARTNMLIVEGYEG